MRTSTCRTRRCEPALYGLFGALLLSLPALAAPATSLSLGAQVQGPLQLSASQLHYVPEQRRIELDGAVSVRVGSLALKAGELVVQLDEQGQPALLEARSSVAFELGPSRGTAEQVTVDLPRGQVVLSGRARLNWQRFNMELVGSAIRLDLKSGQLAVEQARARIRSGAGLGAEGAAHGS